MPAVHSTARRGPMRMLQLAQVMDVTDLRKTKIYELQAEGEFPMRVKITTHAVGWIEEEVQAWIARRVEVNVPVSDCLRLRSDCVCSANRLESRAFRLSAKRIQVVSPRLHHLAPFGEIFSVVIRGANIILLAVC